jgi:dTMP kinase
VIEPALARGDVLCDRFTDATFAYQGGGRGFDTRCWRSSSLGAAGPAARPDLWFDLPAGRSGARRAAARAPDRFEAEDVWLLRARARGLCRSAAGPDPGASRGSTPPCRPTRCGQQVLAAVEGILAAA